MEVLRTRCFFRSPSNGKVLVLLQRSVAAYFPRFARPFTRSPSSRQPPFTQCPFPTRSLVRDEQTSPHKPRLVVSQRTCPPPSPSPHANSFVLGPAEINNNMATHAAILFFGVATVSKRVAIVRGALPSVRRSATCALLPSIASAQALMSAGKSLRHFRWVQCQKDFEPACH